MKFRIIEGKGFRRGITGIVYSATILLLISLTGCPGSKIRLVSLESINDNLRKDFRAMGYISFSDLLSNVEANRIAMEKEVKKEQCFYHRSNPLIMLSTKDMNLTLNGAVNQEGGFKVAAIPTSPTGEVGYQIKTQTAQTIVWPLLPVSFGSIPDMYLKTMVTDLGEMKWLSEDDKKAFFKEINDQHKLMHDRVEQLQKDFNPAKDCDGDKAK